jgi:hypothetical protein
MKKTIWLGVMPKPLVSALSLSALHLAQNASPLFVEYLISSLVPSVLGVSAKTTGVAHAGRAAASTQLSRQQFVPEALQ